MHYGSVEKFIASYVGRFPIAYKVAKRTYQYSNYLIWGNGTFTSSIDPRCRIVLRLGASSGYDPESSCFFGYYDKSPISPSGQRLIYHRLPHRLSQTLEVRVLDLQTGIDCLIGNSHTWNFQQGAMAQWMETSSAELCIFNDLQHQRFVSRVVTVEGAIEGEFPHPLQALSPTNLEALVINYRRIYRLRSEYGYQAECVNYSPTQADSDDGIWRMILASGDTQLIVKLSELIRRSPFHSIPEDRHKVNHCMYSPDGRRFVFMHRCFSPTGKHSILYIADADGSNLRILLNGPLISHYSWRNNDSLIVYAQPAEQKTGYYIIDTLDGSAKQLQASSLRNYGDGHPSYSRDGRWMITDTYPDRKAQQTLLLVDTASGRVYEVGRFFHPLRYFGQTRCDLHPRWTPDGKGILVDTVCDGSRELYLIDIANLLN